jgi:hypothetical protein
MEKYIMSSTTFSGPVTSTAGFITGTGVNIPVTAATLTITTADYNGQTVNLTRAAGITVTLPAATGSNATYSFVVSTTVTSNSNIIKVANATDVLNGTLNVSGATGTVFGTVPASDTITMNGTTTGGLAGTNLKFTCISTTQWLVEGNNLGTGSVATAFATS